MSDILAILSWQLIKKAILVALFVGSVLLLINQFDCLMGETPLRVLPAILTYLVPFFVFLSRQISSQVASQREQGPR